MDTAYKLRSLPKFFIKFFVVVISNKGPASRAWAGADIIVSGDEEI